MSFATGAKTWGISDRSGKRYRLSEMQKEWNGLLVGPDEFEEKHPQLFPPRIGPDPQAVRNPRPDRVEPAVKVLLPFNSLFSDATPGGTDITVLEVGHGRTTADVVRIRDATPFVDSDRYTITVSDTAITGNIRGGGGVASAGPVTVEA